MNIVLKTVLYSYSAIDGVLEGLDELILYKAVSSFQSSSKTLEQVNRILHLRNQTERLRSLKGLVENILCKLLPEEREMVEYKYFSKKSNPNFDYSSRRYFRRQKKLEEKLEKIAARLNVNEEWFNENLSDIYFLRVKYSKLKAAEQNNKRENSARNRAV